MPDDASALNSASGTGSEFAGLCADARLLLSFMLGDRSMSAPPERADVTVDEETITAINAAEDALSRGESPPAATRAQLEIAYQELVKLARPVTATSLKATSRAHGRKFALSRAVLSEAEIWSRKLWLFTVLLIVCAIFGEIFQEFKNQYLPPDDSEAGPSLWLYLLSSFVTHLTPFTYGGIGACAYLLRSAHQYIYRREFDPARIPEYYNRILLGFVAGGSVVLFIAQIEIDDGTTLRLGAPALGFLAGYNTEFLFRAIERIVEAILPRVDLTSVRRASQSSRTSISIDGVSIKDLLARLEAAGSEEDRKVIRTLITKLQNRV